MNDAKSTGDRTLQFVVPADKKKERLDVFLAHQLTSVTRARLKRLIDEDLVLVNSEPTKAGHPLRPGEVIDIFFPAPAKTELEAEDMPLNIIYEDDCLIVLNKPAGLVVHPAYGNMRGTLVNALLAHCRSLSGVGGPIRPGLVHRLDKNTSGLLVVAKDDVTHVALARQLAERKMEREYRAVVWGHFKLKSGRIEAPLARNPQDRTKMRIDRLGKPAVTHYEVLDEMTCTSYLKLNLETGRTHQIRVHMMSQGHPVFADSTYGGRGKQLSGLSPAHVKFMNQLFQKFTRQMLHARILSFRHPETNEILTFTAPIPPDMQELIHILKNTLV
ncbi:RluA family pseudouridine synthase [candidate division KSB1 bacterium]|nr:RluA family pseudouridine synthase [candidate division KSB1 bacterium]